MPVFTYLKHLLTLISHTFNHNFVQISGNRVVRCGGWQGERRGRGSSTSRGQSLCCRWHRPRTQGSRSPGPNLLLHDVFYNYRNKNRQKGSIIHETFLSVMYLKCRVSDDVHNLMLPSSITVSHAWILLNAAF